MSRDYASIARQYEADVIAGRVPVGARARKAVLRNVRDLERAAAGDPSFPYRFDPVQGSRICRAAELLPHIKGPLAKIIGRDEEGRPVWNPIKLEPWQVWFLSTIFGWLNVSNGRRRFRIALLMVPRKNAKSTIAAVILLYLLTADGESGAEVYSAATKRDQAKVVAEIAWEMARRSPKFREFYGVKVGPATQKSIFVPATGSKFEALSSDAKTLDALNVSGANLDELHAHRTRDVYDVIDTATGARPQPLLVITTTAGKDIGGICYEKLTELRSILDGLHEDEQYFGVEYTIDEDDDWRDPAALRKANPNYGVSVDPDDLARKIRSAQRSKQGINNFKTKHANVWVRSGSTWIPLERVQACKVPRKRYPLETWRIMLKDVPCWIAVDLAEVLDVMAKVILFKFEGSAGKPTRYLLMTWLYLPEETIEASPIAQYEGWVNEGYIESTSGNVADYGRLRKDIKEDVDTLNVQEICFDRSLAAAVMQDLAVDLYGDAQMIGDPPIVVVRGAVDVMDPAMKATELLVSARQFEYVENPALEWMFQNVEVVKNDKEEQFPRKAGGKDSPNKIDGVVALLEAMSRAYTPEDHTSAYDDGHRLVIV